MSPLSLGCTHILQDDDGEDDITRVTKVAARAAGFHVDVLQRKKRRIFPDNQAAFLSLDPHLNWVYTRYGCAWIGLEAERAADTEASTANRWWSLSTPAASIATRKRLVGATCDDFTLVESILRRSACCLHH